MAGATGTAGAGLAADFETSIADSGDSGGPLLCDGVLAGVTSCHDDGDWHIHARAGRVVAGRPAHRVRQDHC